MGTFCCKMLNMGLLSRMSQKNFTYALWENNSWSNSLRGSSASCAGLWCIQFTPLPVSYFAFYFGNYDTYCLKFYIIKDISSKFPKSSKIRGIWHNLARWCFLLKVAKLVKFEKTFMPKAKNDVWWPIKLPSIPCNL